MADTVSKNKPVGVSVELVVPLLVVTATDCDMAKVSMIKEARPGVAKTISATNMQLAIFLRNVIQYRPRKDRNDP